MYLVSFISPCLPPVPLSSPRPSHRQHGVCIGITTRSVPDEYKWEQCDRRADLYAGHRIGSDVGAVVAAAAAAAAAAVATAALTAITTAKSTAAAKPKVVAKPKAIAKPKAVVASSKRRRTNIANADADADRHKITCDFPGCTYAAPRIGMVTSHKKIHTVVLPHVCDFAGCTYATAFSQHFAAHRRTHTKERPYKCGHAGCEYASADSSTVTKHRRIHTKEKVLGGGWCLGLFLWQLVVANSTSECLRPRVLALVAN